MKRWIIPFLLLTLSACSGTFKQDEIDLSKATQLIEDFVESGTLDATLMESANIIDLVQAEHYFLCVNNGFIDEFRGVVYSTDKKPLPDTLQFDQYVIRSSTPIDDRWTEVNGLF